MVGAPPVSTASTWVAWPEPSRASAQTWAGVPDAEITSVALTQSSAGSDPLDPASTPTTVVVPALGATSQAVLWGWMAAVGVATSRPRRG